MNEAQKPSAGVIPVDGQVRPVAWRVWRKDGEYELYFHEPTAQQRAECFIPRSRAEPLYPELLMIQHDGLMQTLRDEIAENLRLRELGGAGPDENITDMTERIIRELGHEVARRKIAEDEVSRLREVLNSAALSQFLSDVTTAAGLLEHGKRDKVLAQRIGDRAWELRMRVLGPNC